MLPHPQLPHPRTTPSPLVQLPSIREVEAEAGAEAEGEGEGEACHVAGAGETSLGAGRNPRPPIQRQGTPQLPIKLRSQVKRQRNLREWKWSTKLRICSKHVGLSKFYYVMISPLHTPRGRLGTWVTASGAMVRRGSTALEGWILRRSAAMSRSSFCTPSSFADPRKVS